MKVFNNYKSIFCMYNNFYYWYSKRIVINIITILKTISYRGSWLNRVNIEFENIFEQMHKILIVVQETACKIVENYFHESRLVNISTTILKKWQSLLSCVYFQLYIVDPTYFMLVVIFKKNTTSLCFTLIQCIYLIIKQYSWHTKKVDMLILKKKCLYQ